MGFGTEVRKALDGGLPLRCRFGALRSAVERFSPNGFNATYTNLEQAAGVTDPENWTAEQIVRAAELLRDSHARYVHHRAMWDKERKSRKRRGLQSPSTEELAAFGARSWLDDISYVSSPRSRYRWVALADWVSAKALKPGPVGPDLEGDLLIALEQMPPPKLEPSGSMLAHYGTVPSVGKPATVIEIPQRIYNDPMTDDSYQALSDRQRLLVDCWYSRSHDGHVRERHIRRIVSVEEHWIVPYVVAALGDYVVEIVHEVEDGLRTLDNSQSWHHRAYRDFAENNYDFITLIRQRATSYHHCYYTASYSRKSGHSHRPVYPAFPVLDQLDEAARYRRLYRLPPARPRLVSA